MASAPAIEPATLTLPVKMKLSTKVSILPVTLQLTALRMERKWESRTRMNIGPSRFPPALDHVGYLREGRGDSSTSLQLTLPGSGRAEAYSCDPPRGSRRPRPSPLRRRFSRGILEVQISSHSMKCWRQSLSHEFTEI